MRLNSLQTKIDIIFIIAFALFLINSYIFFKVEQESTHLGAIQTHEKFSHFFAQNRMSKNEVDQHLISLNFDHVNDVHRVLRQGELVKRERGFETIYFENSYYFHVTAPHFRILFKDLQVYPKNQFFIAIFIVLFIFLIFLYAWLKKSLSPLYELKMNINKLANGDLSINCRSDKKDEIAEIANEFDGAVKKIDLLLNSRQLFLRTVMHELKTPIAKGRIVSELIDDEKQKNRMALIFEKLDFLINDFAKIEQIVSKNYEPIKCDYTFNTIIDQAKQMLLDNHEEQITLKSVDNRIISVDLELMAMAVKNLMDNAFKYSSNHCIEIMQDEMALHFISKGKPLSKPLEEYFKPFHNSIEEKNHGMGLGLYIVNSIIVMHGFSFEYSYKEDSNIFTINCA